MRSPEYSSLAVASGSLKTLWHSIVIVAAPTRLSTGAVVSTTLTVRLAEALLPWPSLTDRKRVELGTRVASRLPETWIWPLRSPAHRSLAVAPGSLKTLWHSIVIVAAPTRLSTGAVVSTTSPPRTDAAARPATAALLEPPEEPVDLLMPAVP